MSRFIEFITSPENLDVKKTFGSPIHDGKVPRARREVMGVRVDGEVIDFTDETVPSRLHRTLIEGRAIERKGAIFDCVTFVALMNGVKLGPPDDQGLFTIGERILDDPFDPSDITSSIPLCLVRYTDRVSSGIMYPHVVTPAHYNQEARYLHKLGYEGPVCLSGLSVALEVFRCSAAQPIVFETVW